MYKIVLFDNIVNFSSFFFLEIRHELNNNKNFKMVIGDTRFVRTTNSHSSKNHFYCVYQ